MNEEDDVNLRNNLRKPLQSSSQTSKTDISRETEDAECTTWSKYEMFFYIITYIVMFLSRLGKDLYRYVLGRLYFEQVIPDHILDLTKTSEKLHLENNSSTPVNIRHLTWIQRQKKTLRQYFRAFKSLIVSSEDDRNFRSSETVLLAKDKSHLIPELLKGQTGIIIEASTVLPSSIDNTKPSTSKTETERLATTFKENEKITGLHNTNSQIENVITSDSDDDDSIVVAYLKDKDLTIDVDNSTRKKISVLEKVPKMETIQEELSESSLDVHIPSFPGSPRSLNIGSGHSIHSIESHDPYFTEAIEFLHEDKEFLIAAETGNTKLLQILIRKEENIQQMDHLGRNALHLAVCSDSEAAVIMLLKTKIKTNVKDNLGMTPLSLCLMRRPSYKIANLLFNHGAEITVRSNPVDTGLFLQFVMMCTPTKEDARILELLVEKGALVNDPDAPGGRQALHFAAMSNNCRLIRILVNLSADLTLTNNRNETPKDVAEIFKCKNAYELLSELEEECDLSSDPSSSSSSAKNIE